MNALNYKFMMDVTKLDGSPLGQLQPDVDWVPVWEWGRLTALRRWRDAGLAASAELSLQPKWHPESGAPYVSGLEVTARADGRPAVVADIPLAIFKSSAVQFSRALVEQKKLAAGDLFNYSVSAFPQTEAPADDAADADFEDIPVPVNLTPASLDQFHAGALPLGDPADTDLPVFVPQQVIDEVIALTEQAGKVEQGSVLLGKLHFDAVRQDVFLAVTTQVPAKHTVAKSTSLTLTSDTWTAVEAALALRRRGECIAGWAHSHPAKYWCSTSCEEVKRLRCPLGKSFFSNDDCSLHRTVFWQGYCIAIVVTNAPSGMKVAMYAWNRGVVAPRGFYITQPHPSSRLLATEAGAPTVGETTHETSCQ